MALPKFQLLYFKDLLDIAFCKFFDDYNDQFIKVNGEYHLGNAISLSEIEKSFKSTIDAVLLKTIKPYDVLKHPDFYIIIGACQPKDNYLLRFKTKSFPSKLNAILSANVQLKYLLHEADIKIDIAKFNEACCNVFNQYFNSANFVDKSNMIFLTHRQLDCYSLFKMLKCILGNANCINLKQQAFASNKSSILAVNDLIDANIVDKSKANKDREFKKIYQEVKQFIEMRIQRVTK